MLADFFFFKFDTYQIQSTDFIFEVINTFRIHCNAPADLNGSERTGAAQMKGQMQNFIKYKKNI